MTPECRQYTLLFTVGTLLLFLYCSLPESEANKGTVGKKDSKMNEFTKTVLNNGAGGRKVVKVNQTHPGKPFFL